MKIPQTNSALPIHDYSSAIENAVGWLGERYLLAVPLKVRQPRRPPPPLFLQTRPWLRTVARGR